jgi:hypothetical protein
MIVSGIIGGSIRCWVKRFYRPRETPSWLRVKRVSVGRVTGASGPVVHDRLTLFPDDHPRFETPYSDSIECGDRLVQRVTAGTAALISAKTSSRISEKISPFSTVRFDRVSRTSNHPSFDPFEFQKFEP